MANRPASACAVRVRAGSGPDVSAPHTLLTPVCPFPLTDKPAEAREDQAGPEELYGNTEDQAGPEELYGNTEAENPPPRADAELPSFDDARAVEIIAQYMEYQRTDEYKQNLEPVPPPLERDSDYAMPAKMLAYTERHFHHEDMSAFFKIIEPELTAELKRFYIEVL